MYKRQELLTLAAAVEQGATHPLAQAIVREAQLAELAIPAAESQRALVGSGIEAQVNGERVLICAAGTVSYTHLYAERIRGSLL